MICMYKNQKKRLELTVPTKGVRGLFRQLKEDKIYIRGCNNNKIRAARGVLLKMGWITLLDDYYDFGYNGISQKWGIGENNPRYADYLTFVDKDIIENVVKERKEREGALEVA